VEQQGGAVVQRSADLGSGFAAATETAAAAGTAPAASASTPTPANSDASWDANVRHEPGAEYGSEVNTEALFADGLQAFFSGNNQILESPLAADFAGVSPESGDHAAMAAEDLGAVAQPAPFSAAVGPLAAAQPPNNGGASVPFGGGLDNGAGTAASTFPPLLQPLSTGSAQRPAATNLPLHAAQTSAQLAPSTIAPMSLVAAPMASTATPFLVRGAWFEAAVTATGFTFTPRSGSGVVTTQFVGSDPFAPVTTTAAAEGTGGFFSAAEAGSARAGTPSFAAAAYRDIYPGIDLQYNPTANQNLEYSFVVHPRADPGSIRLGFQGSSALHVDAHGNLVLHTGSRDLVSTVPVLFQEVNGTRVAVSGGYELLGNGQVGFRVGAYDPAQALTIDPGMGSAPHAVDQTATTDEDTPVDIYWLTYNDTSDDGSSIIVTDAGQGAHGATVLNTDGTVTYTPATHWSGTDTFSYTISNGEGTDTADVTVTVNPVDYPPVANGVNVSTNENSPVTVTLSGTDVEGSSLSFAIDQDPSHGTLGAMSDHTVTYYPAGNFSGTDTFTYYASDGEQASSSATVTVTVNAVTQSAGVTITPNGGPLSVIEPGLFGDETSASGTYTVVLNTQPTADVTISVATDGSQLQVSPASLTFTAQNWAVAQTVTVQAVDDQVDQGDHTVTVTHTATSADATYNNISIASLPVSVTEGDFAGIAADPSSEPQGDLNEQGATSANYLVQLTSKPTANVTGTLTPDSEVTLSTYSLTFTPANWDTAQSVTLTLVSETAAEGYHQTTVTLSASSADAAYQGVTNTIDLNIIDKDGPNALSDEVATDENTAATFSVLSNDISPQGYALSIISVSQPANGSVVLNGDGTVTYTPTALWNGTASFGYTLSDGHGHSASSTVTVTVNPVNQPPAVTDPGPQTNAEDAQVSLQLVATDPEQTNLLYDAYGLPPGLVMNAMTGRIWGWIDPRVHGSYTPIVTVDDLDGGVTTISFSWTVTHVNHPPHVFHQTWDTVSVQGQFSPDVVFAVNDIDNDPLTISVSGLPPGVTFDPLTSEASGAATSSGTYAPVVTVSDGQGGTDTDTFFWIVLAQNSAIPLASVSLGNGGGGGGQNLTLVHPAAPMDTTVSLYYPADPDTAYDVTLTVTPAGRATVNTPVVSLRSMESVIVTLSPLAVSQKPEDVTVHAFVAGRETGRVSFTNVGVVLPDHVRGPDTPQSMVDRISIGTGNWGSFNGAVLVAPNLLGVQSVGLDVTRPENDDKYGNAALDPADVERVSVSTHAVVKVIGTVQTAPSLGPDGQPDGLGRNAGKLHLEALVGLANLFMFEGFAGANEPISVTATSAKAYGPTDPLPAGLIAWAWGIEYGIAVKGDGTELKNVRVKEEILKYDSSGQFGDPDDKPIVQKTWLDPNDPNKPLVDSVGFSGYRPKDTKDQAVKRLHDLLLDPANAGDYSKAKQQFRFYLMSVPDKEPADEEVGKVIKLSGFGLGKEIPDPNAIKLRAYGWA
jgi:hypothetical protein